MALPQPSLPTISIFLCKEGISKAGLAHSPAARLTYDDIDLGSANWVNMYITIITPDKG